MKSHKKIRVKGIVQGVGFRPFVFNLARIFNISGFVLNDTEGVYIEAHAEDSALAQFISAISGQTPALAYITEVVVTDAPPSYADGFFIKESGETGRRGVFFSPDTAVCDDCLKEFFDPADRRYHYPFITCIHCGPRFSIVKDIPYDRRNTSMDSFSICASCAAEYSDPADRRFHVQPIACQSCGPSLTMKSIDGTEIVQGSLDTASRFVSLIKQNKIIAVKGVGGYLLACDAASDEAVSKLRQRKRRPFKPFAVMAASVLAARGIAVISPKEEELLESKERPIVLLKTKEALSPLVAPQVSTIGVMLPYIPFQRLLFEIDPTMILVMTSGNIAEEPIIYEDDAANSGFAGIADYIVSYDRDIIAQNDDSVLFVDDDIPLFVRRSRGYVPSPFQSEFSPVSILASGGDLKNTFALTSKDFTIVSQHLGDMAHPATQDAFQKTLAHYMRVFDIKPDVIVSDAHPEYMTTRLCDELAGTSGARRLRVQHHHAHAASVIEEYKLKGPVIGIIFDGTGYGLDGVLWGSEFLVTDGEDFTRAAHFSGFPLPGGEKALKDVWRTGLSLIHSCGATSALFEEYPQTDALLEMMDKKINCPLSCGMGRIFDGISSILGLSAYTSSEAEAALLLEEAAYRGNWTGKPFVIPQKDGVIQTEELTRYILGLLENGTAAEDIASAFHISIAATTLAAAEKIRGETGIGRIVISGGVFHNRMLFKVVRELLEKAGFTVFFSRRLPFNDGCLSYGQAAVARRLARKL
ncbi:MAG: carbamoyltransferase HypF [Leptospirales bacterium]|nr:carbamoyltransferase HypF [Leptospirales bacterium]